MDFNTSIDTLKRLRDDNIASIQADANMSDANKQDSIKQVRDEYTKQSAALAVAFAGATGKRKADSPPETDEEKAIRIAYENKSDTVIRSLRDDKVAEAVHASRAETGKAQQHARGLYREQQGFLASLREDISPGEAKKQFNFDDFAVMFQFFNAFLLMHNMQVQFKSAVEAKGGDVSREGVQRDLLPLIEGTTVSTKHGPVKTDYILFIASGAFHVAKPSDLLPELQGRLPIRVELKALSEEDFGRILREPENSLIKQYVALMGTEGVDLEFTEDAINELARLAAEVNAHVENIGARRLHTVLEKLLDEISFTATDRKGDTVTIDAEYVRAQVSDLAKDADLSKFIL